MLLERNKRGSIVLEEQYPRLCSDIHICAPSHMCWGDCPHRDMVTCMSPCPTTQFTLLPCISYVYHMEIFITISPGMGLPLDTSHLIPPIYIVDEHRTLRQNFVVKRGDFLTLSLFRLIIPDQRYPNDAGSQLQCEHYEFC